MVLVPLPKLGGPTRTWLENPSFRRSASRSGQNSRPLPRSSRLPASVSPMEIPDDYPDALTDELAPYGFEFVSVGEDEEGAIAVLFDAEPESFVRAHPGLGIEESYGSAWPPDSLELWVKFDALGDPIQIDFETIDLLSWAAAMDPGLHDRLNTMAEPLDHAVAVGQALGAALQPDRMPRDGYLD